MRDYDVPVDGSLALLALGAAGLRRWREVRGDEWRDTLRPTLNPAATQPGDGSALGELDLVVVTGLPRSGTSMAMQMLVAGGIPAFTDGRRSADMDNPKGYFEHERVKAIAVDTGWVPDADRQAVKVVAPLVVHLPAGPRYRIVLMQRDVESVLASQTEMLGRSQAAPADAAVLRPAYRRFLQATRDWVSRTPTADLLAVSYEQAVAEPLGVAGELSRFLSTPERALDPVAMAAAVDASLQRRSHPDPR